MNRIAHVLNEGERYDPYVAHDECHVARYRYAKRHVFITDSVIDIACGTGYGTAMLSSSCAKIVGVDISPVAIDYARTSYRNSNAEFIESDLFNYSGNADVVVSFETIEHIVGQGIVSILERLVSLSTRTIIGSMPFCEKEGINHHHVHFGLNEMSLNSLSQFGTVAFSYQTSDGVIHPGKPKDGKIQNLIFVFERAATA